MAKIIGFKGFDKDFKCRDMQYEVGKTFTAKRAVICEEGLHFCEYPLDVFKYYPPTDSRYAIVSTDAITVGDTYDSKKCTTSLNIDAEIDIHALGLEHVKKLIQKQSETGDSFVSAARGYYSVATSTEENSAATNRGDRSVSTAMGNHSVAMNTGDWSVATSTGYPSVAMNEGYYSVATSTGDSSVATNAGYCSVAASTGDSSVAANTGGSSVAVNTGDLSAAIVSGAESVAIALGPYSYAKASVGSWIILAEWAYDNGKLHRIDTQCFKVDGKKIKADTYYTLTDGQLVEKK